MAFLRWQAVCRTYGKTPAVQDFCLEVAEGEVLALLGPSGSGKSTLLRLTAGLDEPTAGAILLEGRDLAGIPAHRRGFGLMFQEYCLFPHLTVEQNVEFGLRMRGMDKAGRTRRVKEMLELVRLERMSARNVVVLSGGEQQRVALARSLAPNPRLLMLDEPLGALDASLRLSLLREISNVLRRVGVTTIYVTHDQAEAMTIAARIALMKDGRLVQSGSPAELMARPRDAFVASFLGLGTLVPGRWVRSGSRSRFVTDLLSVPGSSDGEIGKDRCLLVRPDALSDTRKAGSCGVSARLESRLPRPSGWILRFALRSRNGSEYPAEMTLPPGAPVTDQWMPGRRVRLWIDPSRCRVLPK